MNYDEKTDLSVDALIQEQRRLAASENPLERVVGALCCAGALSEALAEMPDRSIAKLMFDHVWDELNLLSPAMSICMEATQRLWGRSGRTGQ